jgi:hypothetical protein
MMGPLAWGWLGVGEHGIDLALQEFGDHGVQTLAREPGNHVQSPVQVRTDPDHELARTRLVRLLASLAAERKIVIHGILERLLDFVDGLALEGYDIADADDFAMKDAGIGVEFHFPKIAFILHQWFGCHNDDLTIRRPDLTAYRGCMVREC